MPGKSLVVAETKLFVDLSTRATNFLDIAQCLSVLNRRNYTQNHNYHVSRIDLVTAPVVDADPPAYCRLSVTGAPNTWVTANAFTKCRAAWNSSRAEVLKKNPSIEGKWDSFKVFLNKAHASAGVASNLEPSFGNVKLGEWNMSNLILPDWDTATSGDAFHMHLLGPDDGDATDGSLVSAGLIQGYSETRAMVTEKDVPADVGDSWMTRLFDLGGQESELADTITNEGDLPPYDQDDYPGTGGNNELQVLGVGSANNFNLVTSIPGFYAPCGLLRFLGSGNYGPMYLVAVVHITPGTYKGVHGPSMRQ